MPMPTIQARALAHMRAAQANGGHSKSMLVGYTQAALEAEGYDVTPATKAAGKCFADHFNITEPN